MSNEIKNDEKLIAATKRLIKEVKRRPIIWKMTGDIKKTRDDIHETWNQISEIIKVPKAIARTKWKNLRDQYVKEYLKKKKNRRHKPKWRYYEHLKFLKRNLKRSETDNDCCFVDRIAPEYENEPEREPSEIAKNTTVKIEPMEDDEILMSFYTEDTTSTANVDGNAAKKSNKITTKRNNNSHTNARESEIDEAEYDLSYLKSLLPYFQKLKPMRKLVVRNRIEDILLNEIAKSGNSTVSSST